MATTDSPTITDQLVTEISQRVGCPLPCMGHEETKRTYAEILDVVLPAYEGILRATVAQEAEEAAAEFDAKEEMRNDAAILRWFAERILAS